MVAYLTKSLDSILIVHIIHEDGQTKFTEFPDAIRIGS